MPQEVINSELYDTVLVRGRAGRVTRPWQRPNNTTPYPAGALIGDATSAVFELPNAGKPGTVLAVLAASLYIDRSDLPNDMAGFEVDLYASVPPAAVDGAAYAFGRLTHQPAHRATLSFEKPAIRGSLLFRRERYLGEYVTLAADSRSLWFTLRTLGTTTPIAQTWYELRLQLADVGA